MFKKILMPIDLQETHLAAKAVKITIDEARKHDADVYVMTVMPGFGMPLVASFFPDNAMQQAKKEIGAELKKYIAANFPKDITVHPLIGEGSPAEMILAEAKALRADLIIIPSHAKSLGQVFLGSCAAKVVEHAHSSVMVIKEG
jgi:nucleotide-binding universal stress UspA family protein